MTEATPPGAVGERELTITRVFDAPRETVWRAFTEAEQLASWWGPRGFTTPLETIALEPKDGGAFRFTMIDDSDGSEHRVDGSFREVREPERLVFTSEVTGEVELTAVTTITFSEPGQGKTEVVCRQVLVTTDEIAKDSEVGWASQFDRLAEHLARA
jgi:uncharacterized protein YndB with AHSA1/START domain